MVTTILDCYTDEPSGLGVPPYIGTYPRYLAGKVLAETNAAPYYLTIDDLRLLHAKRASNQKTDIKTYNTTREAREVFHILKQTDDLIIVLGVHTPGKYLSAVPGTIREVVPLVRDIDARKIITGPAIFGSQSVGGRRAEKIPMGFETLEPDMPYAAVATYAQLGARIMDQIPGIRIAEIETGRGCERKTGCSFCLEPVKHCAEYRSNSDIVEEIRALVKSGVADFRLGKQSCFYSLPDPVGLLRSIRELPGVDILHIDNVNPAKVVGRRGKEITQAIVRYCSDGNVAAFGVESFDPDVIAANNLNADPETVKRAIGIINDAGGSRGPRGLPIFLPGINILFGLIGESKETHRYNMEALRWIIERGYLIRRINVRKVVPFEGTPLARDAGHKFLKKNGRYYWRWREEIRQQIDVPLLKSLVPVGTKIHGVMTEIHDGKTTFGRQRGTYPLIVGIPGRHELRKMHSVQVISHMKRSITAEIVK